MSRAMTTRFALAACLLSLALAACSEQETSTGHAGAEEAGAVVAG